jgi:hypothetical protein
MDLEYADDIVLLGEDETAMQRLLDNLTECTSMFGMRFSPAKCKLMLQDWVGYQPTLSVAGSPIECVDRFTYLGSCITPGCDISVEISERIRKARAAFANLRHLWKRPDIRLSIKGRVYTAAVRPVLLYGAETWPVRTEDLNRLSVFENRCLRRIAKVRWENRVSNAEIRRRVFGSHQLSVMRAVNLSRLRWLGHVLRMSTVRLPHRAMLATPPPSWKKPSGGQKTTWHRSMKVLTAGLSHVGRIRLPGWGPRDQPHQWLVTLGDMAQSRSQWRSCIYSLLDN